MPNSTSAKFRSVWQDLTFEAGFLRPLYDLVSQTPALLVSCHEKLSRFQIPLDDFTANSAASLAQVGLEIQAFNGRGDISINLETYTAAFMGLQSPQDFEIVVDFSSVVEGCLATLPKFPGFKSRTIRSTGHIKLVEPSDSVTFLSSFISRQSQIRPNTLKGADSVEHVFGFHLHSKEASWDARLQFEPSAADIADIFYSGSITFAEVPERSDTLESRYRFAGELLTDAFAQCGLVPEEGTA